MKQGMQGAITNLESDLFSKPDRKSDMDHSQDNAMSEGTKQYDQCKNTVYNYNDEQFMKFHAMNACMTGDIQVIREYLKSYNVDEFLHSGWTPLLHAASFAQAEAIEYLLMNGANPNKYKDGYTPLMALCNSSNGTGEERLKCLTLLMNANVDVNAISKQRETPLIYACKSQEPEFVTELIKTVKNINALDNTNKTALMYAVLYNKLDTVKILLENKADTSLTDHNNLSAKDIAAIKGHTEILSLLQESESEIHTREITDIDNWKQMFPSLAYKSKEAIDYDVATLLYGMGLEQYTHIFQGIDLKTFLKLTENDLGLLGLNISAHRVQFMEYLHKFHRKKWNVYSIGIIKKSSPYIIHNGVVLLGTISKHIAVISSSFQYVKNTIITAADQDVRLSNEQTLAYEEQFKKTQKALVVFKQEILRMKTLAETINKKNNLGVPATYIGKKKENINWYAVLTTTIAMGIYLLNPSSSEYYYPKFLTLTTRSCAR